MKKTLITLLAVGSCAMGVTLEDAIGILNSTTTTLAFDAATSSTYYMTVVLNDTALLAFQKNTAINDTIASLTLGTTTAGLAVGTTSSVSKVKGSGYVAGTSLSKVNSVYWTNSDMEATNTISGITQAKYVAITFGIIGGEYTMDTLISTYNAQGDLLGSSSYVALTYASSATDGSAVLKGAAIDATYIANGYVFSGQYDKETLLEANTAAISAIVPEPATATLSLLALCGLAMRRRRK